GGLAKHVVDDPPRMIVLVRPEVALAGERLVETGHLRVRGGAGRALVGGPRFGEVAEIEAREAERRFEALAHVARRVLAEPVRDRERLAAMLHHGARRVAVGRLRDGALVVREGALPFL